MSDDQADTHLEDVELHIANLGSPRMRAGRHAHLPSFSPLAWQRLILGLSLVLLAAVLLANVLSRSGRYRPAALPTASETAGFAPIGSTSLPPTPAEGQLAPTIVPNNSAGHAVAPAPAPCSPKSPVLTEDGNPTLGEAIGKAPVLLGGFSGPYATLPIGPDASGHLNDPGWTGSYTQYGWPALIELIVYTGVSGSVTLSGQDIQTGYPLWFGFVVAGVWGAPQQVTSTYSLNPAQPSIPAGGETGLEDFWYGYVFLPGAGCYTLSATWPSGRWQITISAGAVNSGG
jgi:hypothetical protein